MISTPSVCIMGAMSRRRNKKRRKDRKDRAEDTTKKVQAQVRETRGGVGRKFFGKARRGDAAALELTFGKTVLASYDEDGNLSL